MSSTELWGLVGVVILIFSVILLMKDLARPTSGPSLQERARQIEQERQIDLACAKLRAETVQNIIRAAMAEQKLKARDRAGSPEGWAAHGAAVALSRLHDEFDRNAIIETLT